MTDTLIAVPQPHNARSLYTELATQIRGSGLLNRRYAYYWTPDRRDGRRVRRALARLLPPR